MENSATPFAFLLSSTTVIAVLFFGAVMIYSFFLKTKKSCDEAAKLALQDEPLDENRNP